MSLDKWGLVFLIFSPLTSQNDQFSENVNLIVQDLTGYNLNLKEYTKISEGQVKTIITDGKIIDSQLITNGDTVFQIVINTGKQGIFDLKFEQYYWVWGDSFCIDLDL